MTTTTTMMMRKTMEKTRPTRGKSLPKVMRQKMQTKKMWRRLRPRNVPARVETKCPRRTSRVPKRRQNWTRSLPTRPTVQRNVLWRTKFNYWSNGRRKNQSLFICVFSIFGQLGLYLRKNMDFFEAYLNSVFYLMQLCIYIVTVFRSSITYDCEANAVLHQ